MSVLETVNSLNLGLIFKIAEATVAIIFILYSVLTLRQVSIMNQSLITPIEAGVRAFALVQLTVAILILFLILLV